MFSAQRWSLRPSYSCSSLCPVASDRSETCSRSSPTSVGVCEQDQGSLCSESRRDIEALLRKTSPTLVPKLQLTSLCLARLSDPITFTQIFPYINEMIQGLGIVRSPSQVGFYSGLVESAFGVSQLLTIFPLSRLSDGFGRRPVVLLGVVGLALATIAFGFARTMTAILITRCLAGAFAGNVATMQVMLTEMSDPTNQTIMLPAYGLCWPIGYIIGPLIGGIFANPKDRIPFFTRIKLFNDFPYLLPCCVSGTFALFTVVVAFFCLDETSSRKGRKTNEEACSVNMTGAYGTMKRTDPTFQMNRELDDNVYSVPSSVWTISSLLAVPAVRDLTISSLMLSFVSGGFDVLFVLFSYVPIDSGGLSYSPSDIGYALAIAGTSAALLQVFAMPYLLRRFDVLAVYKACMKLWPMAYFFLPCLNILARTWSETDSRTGTITLSFEYSMALRVVIGICLAITRFANLAFSLNVLLVKDTSPSYEALSLANGLGQFAMCLARCITPVSVSVLFTFSVKNNILGSYFWVCIMMVCSYAAIYVTDRIYITDKVAGVTDKFHQ